VSSRLVAVGSALAAAGAVHAAVNTRLVRRADPAGRARSDVSVLVPARDEADTISGCIAALVGQPGVREVLVLDDASTDATAELARAAGARVITGVAPPRGWLGKPWACAQLASRANPVSDVLVFVDADVRLRPGAVSAAVALLDATELDIICPFPRQEAEGLAERLVQPLLQWSWLMSLPLRLAERSPRPSLTAANGQFLVVRRAALERAGGHAAVRAAVLDDIALVRAVKAAGGRGGVADGSNLADCRMYRSWAELRDGYGKSLWAAFGSPPQAAGALGVLTLAYVVPALAAVRGSRAGLAGYLSGVASRLVAARATGARAWPDAFAHPLSIILLDYLTIRSHVQRRRGRLTWKSRPVP
jgi:hypothetical protein